jgi:CRP-like cAMP-binding protein
MMAPRIGPAQALPGESASTSSAGLKSRKTLFGRRLRRGILMVRLCPACLDRRFHRIMAPIMPKMMPSTESKAHATTLDAADWETVCTCPLFSAVGRDMVARLCGHRRPLLLEPRQIIFSQGDKADAFYVVLDGWVKLYRITPSGEEAVVGVFTRGESFAEPVIFLGGGYPASAEAASPVRLVKIDAVRFSEAIETEPGLAATLLASVVLHTERLFGEIASLKLLSAPRRLAEFLVRQAPPGSRSATVVLPYDKMLLAGRLGMAPESLSRALATLRKLGVKVLRDRVTISDVPALEAFARPARRGAPDQR